MQVLRTNAAFSKFSDPQAEGPFTTTASRCMANAYIKRQIKGYERILCYYKRSRNALTTTCRIPPKILGAIFGEVVRCAESRVTRAKDFRYTGHMEWIPSVSHVCSHWREVALAAPNLWSIIPLDNPPWAREMVERANPVPLTIKYQGPINITNSDKWTGPYRTLREILRLHLPYIRNLMLVDSRSTLSLRIPWEPNSASPDPTDILSLLNQPAPRIERLEVRLSRNSGRYKLPYELFTMSPRLSHLVLEGCGMAWDSELIDFGNLRLLELSFLSRQTNPSLSQLLTLLRQTSHLECLIVENKNMSTGLGDSSILHGIDAVALGHLERITLMGDLSYCVLLNYIVFSRNADSIRLSIRNFQDISSPLAQALARKFDNGIEGSTVSLSFGSNSIRFWKSKDTTKIPSFHNSPTIDISTSNINIVGAKLFWQSFRLDQLMSLDIDNTLDQDSWTFFGNLPKLLDLRVCSSHDQFLNSLQKSMADAQTIHMTFPVLRNLTMFGYFSDEAAIGEQYADNPCVSGVQLMLSCFELRKKAGLSLDSLRLDRRSRINTIQLERLRVIIDQVEWIEPDLRSVVQVRR